MLALVLAAAAVLPVAAVAAPGVAWRASDEAVMSTSLSDYREDAASREAVLSFAGIASNSGAAAQRIGAYVGWAWSYDFLGQANALPWSKTAQLFQGGGVSLVVERIGEVPKYIALSDVLGDTWIGAARDAGHGETPISTQGSWTVPLLDFGTLNANESANFALTVTVHFDTAAAFADWSANGGDVRFLAQGLAVPSPVPEPAQWSVMLAGMALLGARIRRHRIPSPLRMLEDQQRSLT